MAREAWGLGHRFVCQSARDADGPTLISLGTTFTCTAQGGDFLIVERACWNEVFQENFRLDLANFAV